MRRDVHFQSIPIILLYLCRFRYQPSQISAHLNSHTYRTYSMSLIVDWLINNPPLNGSTNMLLYNNSLITYYCNLIFDLWSLIFDLWSSIADYWGLVIDYWRFSANKYEISFIIQSTAYWHFLVCAPGGLGNWDTVRCIPRFPNLHMSVQPSAHRQRTFFRTSIFHKINARKWGRYHSHKTHNAQMSSHVLVRSL